MSKEKKEENFKKISDWQVLTPDGFKDFEGVKKVKKDYVLKITLENEQQILCSGGHQLFVKRKKQEFTQEDTEGFLFADLIEPFNMLIKTRNDDYQTVLCVEKICNPQDMFDLVNVKDGYRYYTNDILSHNCAHVEGIDELWLGLWPTLSCLVGNTKVFTDKGIFAIEDFHKGRSVGEYFEIDGWQVYGKNGLERLSHGYVSPESDTIKLTTKHGYNVEGTLKHPLWVLDYTGGSMKQIQHIKPGDYLRIQVGMNCYGTQQLDPDLAYMLGGYSAEGCIKKRKRNRIGRVEHVGIQITNSDSEFRDVYLNRAKNTIFEKNFRAYGKHNLTLYSVSIVKELENLGLNINELSYNKTIPKIIWTTTKQTQQNYLSGLFDGDGTAYKGIAKIELTSEQMIKDVQLLLLNMGFHPNVNKKLARNKLTNTKSARTTWVLEIPKSESAKFAKEIGFKIQRKQKQMLSINNKKNSDLNRCPISLIRKPLNEIIQKSNKSKWWFHQNGLKISLLQDIDHNRSVSNNWLCKFKNLVYLANPSLLLDADITEFFNNIIGNFFWDVVVETQSRKAKTYDFTVPCSHTFLQNGILGSNTGGSAILISSPSGVGTLFHKIWLGAKEGEDGEGKPNPGQGTNNFYRIELPWTVHPERDQKWFEEQKAEIISAKGERGVNQELLCAFNSSGDTFLKTEFLDTLENNCSKPIAYYGPSGNVWIWKYAEPDHKYLITADIARGDAGDFSTIQVIDTTKDEQVAEFQGKIPPDDLADLMIDLGFKYNQALLCPELNSFGLMTATTLKKSNYKNLFYEKFSRNAFITPINDEIKDEMPGITTSAKTREEMLAKLEGVLRNQKIRLYSVRLMNEIKTFIWKNNKAQAMKGYNDDLIMSLAIACNLYEAAGTTAYDSLEVAISMLQGMSRNTNFMGKNGEWAQKNTYMPPIIPTNISVLQPHEKMRNTSITKSQNMHDPILRHFKWIIDD